MVVHTELQQRRFQSREARPLFDHGKFDPLAADPRIEVTRRSAVHQLP